MKHSTLILLPILLAFSCKSKIEKELQGIWVVEDIKVTKDVDYFYQVTANLITFDKNNAFSAPITSPRQKTEGTWKIAENNNVYNVEIQIDNELFAGKYKLEVIERSPKFVITLQSDTLFMQLSKIIGP